MTLAEDVAPRVAELAVKGLGRNEIAAQLNVSKGTVTKAAAHADVSFDRSATEPATNAAVADSKTRRTRIAVRFLDVVEQGLDELPSLEPRERQSAMVVIGTALDKNLKIELHDRDTAATGAGAIQALGSLMAAIRGSDTDEVDDPYAPVPDDENENETMTESLTND